VADAADGPPARIAERVAALLAEALADAGHAARCAAMRDPAASRRAAAAALIAGLAGREVAAPRAARMRLASLTPAQRAQVLRRRPG